jgi:hypothetical protein
MQYRSGFHRAYDEAFAIELRRLDHLLDIEGDPGFCRRPFG